MTSAILFFGKKTTINLHIISFQNEGLIPTTTRASRTHKKKKLVDIGAVSFAVNLLVTFNRAAAW